MQANLDEKYFTRVEYFSHVNGIKCTLLRWDFSTRWGVSSQITSPLYWWIMARAAIISSDFSYNQFQTKIIGASHRPHRLYCISIRFTCKCKRLIYMILMITNNHSFYSDYNEVNRGLKQKNANVLNSIILWYMMKQAESLIHQSKYMLS